MSSHLNAVWVSRRIGVGPCLTVYLLVLSITRFDRTSQSTELRYIISGAYLSNIWTSVLCLIFAPSIPTYSVVKETQFALLTLLHRIWGISSNQWFASITTMGLQRSNLCTLPGQRKLKTLHAWLSMDLPGPTVLDSIESILIVCLKHKWESSITSPSPRASRISGI